MQNLPLAGYKPERTEIAVRDTNIGGRDIILMAGPCAVESGPQMHQAAAAVKQAGGTVLRGGVYKPRTSPYAFQGLGREGLTHLTAAAKEHDLLTVTEVIDPASLDEVLDHVDIIQIGARNMQNFQLLKLAGQSGKPVILKRGLSATIEEWLSAAEYILTEENPNVILCERGIRTFETSTRNTLDLSAIAVIRKMSHLPVIVDPSHAAGHREYVPALSKAAVAAGADGLLIEMHPHPEEAKSDGVQSLTPTELQQLAADLVTVAASVGRTMVGTGSGLDSLRSKIDSIDSGIIELLAERMHVVKLVAREKSPDRIRDHNREQEIIQRLGRIAAELQCPADLVREIYALIFDHAIKTQLQDKAHRLDSMAYGR
ncbi:MAG: 3-deoxy-7-phosphoheptulonate synthase [Desulfitobacteriaceae bacterium]